jgi:hypothetical protein
MSVLKEQGDARCRTPLRRRGASTARHHPSAQGDQNRNRSGACGAIIPLGLYQAIAKSRSRVALPPYRSTP